MSNKRAYVSANIRLQIEQRGKNRCAYCLTSSLFTAKKLHIEHIIPISAGGGSDLGNLCLSCELCNSYKGVQTHGADPFTEYTTPLFHPNQQTWEEHFQWNDEGTLIIGITATGRSTVEALKLNNILLYEARGFWVRAGWHPPQE